jgi:hypothetical protein
MDQALPRRILPAHLPTARLVLGGAGTPRPGVVAHYTNDLIYARLAPDLLRQLRERNPLDESGRRKARHHQHLNEDVGHPALASHLYAIISIMRRVDTWDTFMLWVDRIHPRWGTSLLLPLVDDLLPSQNLPR